MVRPVLDRVSVDGFLGLFYVPPDRCIDENIHVPPPAHAATVRAGDENVRPWSYWATPLSRAGEMDRVEAVGEIRRLLSAAVRRQMAADVPLGCRGRLRCRLLSGGRHAGKGGPGGHGAWTGDAMPISRH